ncbi:MAG: hydrogenase iron-sulfur subunit [Deltaproteobacteria bacterium]|nr:hydrogenase iron-sulfur subunit [Deltaproteobacteria bacterium]MBW2600723.1 hydrogenase iron-sulfur subunit [Deltaproteobacteria bacterium]
MQKKVGVYICTGCGIGDALDIEKLDKKVPPKIKFRGTHPFLCGPEGVELIKKDVEGEGVNTVVVAACSRRVCHDVFNFGPEVIVDRVNLREGVVWSHKPRKDAAPAEGEEGPGVDEFMQEMAQDYVRMGLAEAEKMKLPELVEETIDKKIIVLGGGVTGLTAALDVAKAGYEATIIEKAPKVGGFAAKMRKQTPSASPYEALQQPVIDGIIKEAEAHPKITIRTETEVARIAGQPGLYDITFKPVGTKSMWDVMSKEQEAALLEKMAEAGENPASREPSADAPATILNKDPDAERFGAVILATGWKPWEPATQTAEEKPAEGEATEAKEGEASEEEQTPELPPLTVDHLGLGKFPDVVTNVAFEEMAAEGKIKRPSDGKPAQSVAFLQCPGKGSDEDFPYASSITSMVALKQAKYVREDNPEEGKAYIFYQHMRTPGQNEYFYKSIQQDDGIFLTKGDVVSVSQNGEGLIVEANDTLLGDKIKVKADMVVLGTGMVPTTRDEPVLNLAYRQGPGFLDLDLFEGYADSNFICFPYETRRTGIYVAGTVRRAQGIQECIEDAAGAALKAIQCLESANRGMSVHPRSGDKTTPEFFFQRCTQCKRCTEECPFGALDDDEKGTPLPNPTRCRRCGTCMGACPERIISFSDYSIDSIGSMVKAIEVPEEDDEKLRVLVLACENDAYPALDLCAMNRMEYSSLIRVIPVRCLGSVNVVWIKDALSKGIDGILLIGCKYGDDYQCHFIKGSELADIRMDKIGEALVSLALEKERVQQIQIAIDEYDKLPGMIKKFVDTIQEVGPNPFKGF